MASRSRQQPPAGQAPSSGSPQAQGQPTQSSRTSSSNIAVSLPSASLPKAGGAIRDIGEKFDVNAATGTGSMKIDIAISKSRSDMQPNLALQYNSGSGNGPFGLGWGVAVPSITRKTDKGLPRYFDFSSDDKTDVFLYGGEDLVPVFKRNSSGGLVYDSTGNPVIQEETRGGYIVRQYRPRIEDSFSRIERFASLTTQGEIYWRIMSKDNATNIYGMDSTSRIVDSTDSRRIFSWLISESYDVTGNAVIYNYKGEDSANVGLTRPHEVNRDQTARSNNRYLKCIRYGNRAPNRDQNTWAPFSAFTLPVETWMFSVVFDYGEHSNPVPTTVEDSTWLCRQDPYSSYRSGYEIRTYRLCQRILMFHHFPKELGLTDYLVSSTNLVYQTSLSTSLAQVIHVGYIYNKDQKQYTSKAMAPVEFTYSQFPSDEQLSKVIVNDISADGLQGIPGGVDGKTYQFVDLDGEGLPGVFAEQGSAWYYGRNLSSGDSQATVKFGPMETVGTKSSASMSGGELRMSDLDGDGHLDLVQLGPDACGYYQRTTSGGWFSYREFASVPNINFGDPNLRFLDITGNGLADILISGDEIFTWYASLGDQGYGNPGTSFKTSDENTGPRIIFADPDHSIYLADMSGDGLSDVVRIRNGDVCYWPNMGYGLFGPKVKMDNSPWFDNPDNFNQQFVLIADIDGTGTSDIIYLTKNEIRMYLNDSGNGFTDPKILKNFAGMDNVSNVTAIDILGSGTTSLVWSCSLPGSQQASMKYIDLMHGVKPNLLIKTVNNLGGSQLIHYVSSTKFYQADKAAGNPWVTRLAFPVYVIEKVEHVDSISRTHFATRYAYHHGYFDGFEREFRGFAMVEQWDTEDYDVMNARASSLGTGSNLANESHVPPVYAKRWFHTGAYLDEQRISQFLVHEYFGAPQNGDNQGLTAYLKLLLPDTVLPSQVTTVEARREACRALKGQILRTEIYAVDGNPNPYTVGESNYTLEVLQSEPDGHIHCSYKVHEREAITYTFDRNQLDDPRIQHEMLLQVDVYGQPMKSLKIVYGRTPGKTELTGADRAIQETTLIVYDEKEYTNAVIQSDNYLLPKVFDNWSYQVYGAKPRTGQTRFQLEDFLVNNFAAVTGLPTVPYETSIADESVAQKRLLSRSQVLYRKDDLSAFLPAGQTESMAIRGEVYQLCLTSGMLNGSYKRTQNNLVENLIPDPTLTIGGKGGDQGGYVDLEADGNWWIPSGLLLYAPNPNPSAREELAEARAHFYQPRQHVNAFDQRDTSSYDSYDLFALQTQDAVGNITQSLNDYRVLKPYLLTDPNGNRTQCVFDELGFNVGTAAMSKPTDDLGDSLEIFNSTISDADMDAFFLDPLGPIAVTLLGSATTRGIYHVRRFWNDPNKALPPFSATISRKTHGGGTLSTVGDIQVILSFSDGSGSIVQNKAQVDPGPLVDGGPTVARWLGTGWRFLNNKKQTIKNYEPFFDDSHDFKFEEVRGVSSRTFYDPVGRVVATLNPDHSWTKTVFSPWKEVQYDENDTVLMDPKADPDVGAYFQQIPDAEYLPTWFSRMSNDGDSDDKDAATKAAVHSNTPATTHKDPLNRKFIIAEDNGADGIYTSHLLQDILGDILVSRDALERIVEQKTYDMTGNVIYIATMDTGERWTLFDVSKNPLCIWDSRNQRYRSVFDPLRRVIEMHYSIDDQAEQFVSKTVFGESAPNAAIHNLRTETFQSFDQAGMSTNVDFDFKGNLLKYRRQIAEEYKARLDWSLSIPLEETLYTTSTMYDALDRVLEETTPDNTTTLYTYNEGGQLKAIDVNLRGALVNDQPTWERYTSDIQYNAKAQRLLVTYGNGAQKSYTYDPMRFRLTKLQTTRNTDTLQSLSYHYDPSGNVTSIRDLAQQEIFFRNQRVDPSSNYTYDAVYRLIKATGREQLGITDGARNGPTVPAPIDRFHTRLDSPGDGNALGTYTETYKYDSVGNILSVQHAGSDAAHPGWTRNYTYKEQSLLEAKPGNRLSSTTVGSDASEYSYDANGNMSLPHLSLMQWDFMNQLQATARQKANTGTPETTWYVYNSSGVRVRKVTERYSNGDKAATRLHERLYLGKVEIHRKFAADGKVIKDERESFHVMDDQDRVAIVESQTIGRGPAKLSRYQFKSLVDSVALELDDQAQIVSYEEYTPFGTTSYQGVSSKLEAPKRYRFTGKECDGTGLYYHGARYYASWLGRWTSPDPIGTGDGFNLYCYVMNNPISRNDPSGKCGGDKTKDSAPKKAPTSGVVPFIKSGALSLPSPLSSVLLGAALPPVWDSLMRIVLYKTPMFLIAQHQLGALDRIPGTTGEYASSKRETFRIFSRLFMTPQARYLSKNLQMGNVGGGEGYPAYQKSIASTLPTGYTQRDLNAAIIWKSAESRGLISLPKTGLTVALALYLTRGATTDISNSKPEDTNRLIHQTVFALITGSVGGSIGSIYDMHNIVKNGGNMVERIEKLKGSVKQESQKAATKSLKAEFTSTMILRYYRGSYIGGVLGGVSGLLLFQGYNAIYGKDDSDK